MSERLRLLGEVPEPTTRAASAVLAKGFRPFFLLASAFSACVLPLWLLALAGALRVDAYFDPVTWHAHEMIFGFAAAVIAGFLLTAVGNWTSRETLVGAPLGGLAALWLAGRLAILAAARLPLALVAAVDLAFLPALWLAIARPLVAARSRRNYIMLAVLAALFAANLAIHLDVLGVVAGWRRRASLVAVDVVVLVILVVGGRVLPMFTRNATGDTTIRSLPVLDRLVIAAMALLVVCDAGWPEHEAAPALAGLTAVLAAARTLHWGARRSLGQPMLWILHLGILWIPVGLAIRALAHLLPPPGGPAATHALTAGSIGGLTLGMMARVTLGHTGRLIQTRPAVTVSFALVTLAALLRVTVPLLAGPETIRASLFAAGVLWTAAFAAHLATSARALVSARVDGKPG